MYIIGFTSHKLRHSHYTHLLPMRSLIAFLLLRFIFNRKITFDRTDLRIGHKGEWNRSASSAIVIQKYKLIFFTIPKAGCSTFRMLARRMEGFDDYHQSTANYTKKTFLGIKPVNVLHNRTASGLKYMYDYSKEEQMKFLTNDEWVKAVFIRDPKTRLVSAWLDKAVKKSIAARRCCPIETWKECADYAQSSFLNFINLARQCKNIHWIPQTEYIGAENLPYINFVGRLENIEEDARKLLIRIGAWETCGKDGWGQYENTSFAHGDMKSQHSTNSSATIKEVYTPEVSKLVERWYQVDYDNKLFRQYRK